MDLVEVDDLSAQRPQTRLDFLTDRRRARISPPGPVDKSDAPFGGDDEAFAVLAEGVGEQLL